MIYEFALDPAFFLELADNKGARTIFKSSFSYGKPCVIAGYPANLSKKVLALFNEQIEKSKTPKQKANWENKRKIAETELLRLLASRTTKRVNCWGDSYLAENQRLPFEGILTRQSGLPNARDMDWVLNGGLEYPGTIIVPRHPDKLNEALEPLLRNATAFTFVDPYFMPEKRFLGTYSLFISTIMAANPVRVSQKRDILIVCKRQEKFDEPYFVDECRKNLPGLLRPGTRLSIHRIEEKEGQQEIHNRYILTNIGCVQLGHGTDCTQDRATDTCDDLALLAQNPASRWLAAYKPGSPTFIWHDPVIIEGS